MNCPSHNGKCIGIVPCKDDCWYRHYIGMDNAIKRAQAERVAPSEHPYADQYDALNYALELLNRAT